MFRFAQHDRDKGHPPCVILNEVKDLFLCHVIGEPEKRCFASLNMTEEAQQDRDKKNPSELR